MHPEVIYSNQLEQLVEQLGSRLFPKQKGDPLARRWVLVPTPAMKSWVQTELATRLGVASGIRFLFLQEAVGKLSGSVVPSADEYSLRIELVLRERLEDRAFGPVRQFLARNPDVRIPVLAAQLADHFLQYGLYGGAMVAEFRGRSWQELLWEALALPYWAGVLEGVQPRSLCDQLHLFGFSHIPPLFYRFLRPLAPTTYVLSPCFAFWADIRSDREARALLRYHRGKGAQEPQIEELAHYLRDRNRLLANFGRLGRQLISLVEDEVSSENYVQNRPETCLQAVQEAMLTLESSVVPALDDSIAVHSAPTKWREVQVLHQLLRELFSKSTPSVLVMAPDIGEYAPLIRAVFQHEIPAQIQDISHPAPDSIEAGIELLVALAESRWEVSKVLQLLEHPKFQGISDVATVRRWVEQAHIRWGVHGEHRRRCLERAYGPVELADHASESTWQQGILRLLGSLGFVDGLPWVELTELDQLEAFVDLFAELPPQLAPFLDAEYTLSAWADALDELCQRYFGAPFPNATRLRTLGRRMGGSRFRFESIRHIALHWESRIVRGHDLSAVQFCSMTPMRAIPADVICLIGMNEGAFPRATPKQPLNLLHQSKKGDPFPSRVDFDRYLFLESLLSARQKLVITYRHEADDGQSQGPSLVVSELLTYLDQTSVHRHPQLPHDRSYFGAGNCMPLELFQRIETPRPKLPAISSAPSIGPATPKQVTVAELSLALRDPISIYLKHALGVQIPELRSLQALDVDRCALSALDEYEFLWGLSYPWRLPPPPFRQRALRRLQEQRAALVDQLRALQLESTSIQRRYPLSEPLCIDGWEVTGEISLACTKGVIHRGDRKLGSVVQSWPRLLAHGGELLFLPLGTSLASPSQREDHLRLLLQHYQECLKRPVVIAAHWLAEGEVRRAVARQRWLSPSLRWWLQRNPCNWEEEASKLVALPRLLQQIEL